MRNLAWKLVRLVTATVITLGYASWFICMLIECAVCHFLEQGHSRKAKRVFAFLEEDLRLRSATVEDQIFHGGALDRYKRSLSQPLQDFSERAWKAIERYALQWQIMLTILEIDASALGIVYGEESYRIAAPLYARALDGVAGSPVLQNFRKAIERKYPHFAVDVDLLHGQFVLKRKQTQIIRRKSGWRAGKWG